MFRVGTCFFDITSDNESTLDDIEKAFPLVQRDLAPLVRVIDIDKTQSEFPSARNEPHISKVLRALRHKVYQYLSEHIYVHGVLLADSHGRKLLIVGQSGAGKTTLSLALAELSNWKIIAEDVVFIDQYDKSLIDCRLPLSVRASSRPLLSEIGIKLQEDLFPGWVLNLDWFSVQRFTAPFDYVVILEPPKSDALRITELQPVSIITKILHHTNALYIEHGTNILNSTWTQASCRLLEGGLLRERFQAVRTLIDGVPK